jgi:hypothetical protein
VNQFVDSTFFKYSQVIFWRARCFNQYGDTFQWSPIWKYTTNAGPTWATSGSIFMVDPMYFVNWTNAGLSRIQIQLDTNLNFNTPNLQERFPLVGKIQDTFQNLMFGKDYYVRLRGFYGNSFGSWSSVQAIRIKNNVVQHGTLGRAIVMWNFNDAVIEGNEFIGGAVSYIGWPNTKFFDVTLKNNTFTDVRFGGDYAISIFTGDRLTLEGNIFKDCGAASGAARGAIEFNTGTTSYVKLLNNVCFSPGSYTVQFVRDASHTFAPETNSYLNNTVLVGTNQFPALYNDVQETGWGPTVEGGGSAGTTNAPSAPSASASSAATIRQWGISLRDTVTGRVQLRFSSTEASPAPSDKGGLVPALWDVTGLKLEAFRPDERSDFIIESPSCRVNVTTRDAGSIGSFTARRETDGISIRGHGFQFDGTERRLTVTNSVQIELRTRLFQPKPASP